MESIRKPKRKHSTKGRQRLNAKSSRNRLYNLINLNFVLTGSYFVFKLDTHNLPIKRDTAILNIKCDIILPLWKKAGGFKYIYAVNESADGIFVHLVTDAPPADILAFYSRFWLCGEVITQALVSDITAEKLADEMTVGIFGKFGGRVKKMFISSLNLIRLSKNEMLQAAI